MIDKLSLLDPRRLRMQALFARCKERTAVRVAAWPTSGSTGQMHQHKLIDCLALEKRHRLPGDAGAAPLVAGWRALDAMLGFGTREMFASLDTLRSRLDGYGVRI